MAAIISIGTGILALGALVLTLTLSGCSFRPGSNIPETVYGPPEMFENFDPSENIEEDVYGPPEMFGLYSGSEEGVLDGEPVIQEDMDIPPETVDDEHDHTEESDVPEDFQPEDNITPDIYGPPESFN